jgi:hypothetical protein
MVTGVYEMLIATAIYYKQAMSKATKKKCDANE